jgi:hypothetical protein
VDEDGQEVSRSRAVHGYDRGVTGNWLLEKPMNSVGGVACG